MMKLTDLSDGALVQSLEAICVEERGVSTRMILHLMEVEERRLHLEAAYSSMFDFCTRRLGMGEGAAFRRINAARLARRFPRILASLERGDVSLETLVLVRSHLTETNVDEVLAEVARKGKRQVAEIMARRSPQPDAPSLMRKLPAAKDANGRIDPIADARYKLQLTASAELCAKVERARALLRHRNPSGDLSIVIERALDALIEKLEKERLAKTSRGATTATADAATADAATTATAPAAAATNEARTGANVRAPSGICGRPGISRQVRRAVFERDGEQCTFTSTDGVRCLSRERLELDHVEPYALGGSGEVANLRVLCRAHNTLHAEQRFGRGVVERGMDFRRRKSMTRKAAPRPAAVRGRETEKPLPRAGGAVE